MLDVDRVRLDEVLVDLTDRAQRAWPDLPLTSEVFVRHLANTLDAKEVDILEVLRSCHAEDLYLACACAAGINEARAAFALRFQDTLEMAIRRVDASPAFVDEVRQLLHQRLFFESGEQFGRIAGYRGRGPLAGWAAITAQRIALNVCEQDSARERAHQRASDHALLMPTDDPELRFLKERYAPEFERAFAEALDRISTRDRAILGFRIVSKLTLERIGVIYNVDESTASRWFKAARTHLETEAESILRIRLKLSKKEMQSLARLVASQLDVSIARLLSPEKPDSESED